MIEVTDIEVFNFDGAIRGMRNPLNSWHKLDSRYEGEEFVLGLNDLCLMQRLYKGGSEHRKYLRQIMVTMDITAPLYWWKEFDTYKVGTTANSCSTMHKIHAKEFTLNDFSYEHLLISWNDEDIVPYEEYYNTATDVLSFVIEALNHYRKLYLKTNNKKYWWQMIQLLPSSYNQKRTVTMNYEVVMNMINQRSNHKLDEWREFVDILKGLPYVLDIRGEK